MVLKDKQKAKVDAIIDTVDLGEAHTALVEAGVAPTLASIRKVRTALKHEIAKLDKALAVYGVDLATDEARALIAKVEGKK